MYAAHYIAMFYAVILTKHMLTLVFIAAIVEWLLGALWYGVIFKKSWRKFAGFTEGEKPKNRFFGMVISFVACLLISYVLAHIVGWERSMNFTAGADIAIICWLGFVAPTLFTQHIFENRRANLFAINACYWLLAMAIGGGILAAFHS